MQKSKVRAHLSWFLELQINWKITHLSQTLNRIIIFFHYHMQNQTTKNDKHILNAPSTAVKTASFGPVSNPHFIEYDTRTPNRLANGQCLYTGGYLIFISVTPLIPIHLFMIPALTEDRSRFKRHSKLCTVILYQKKDSFPFTKDVKW